MKIFRKNNGAVSVFLALILVPTLLITSIFVDVGRVYLSRSVVESSADLALNSVITRYDRDLLEWYGLMGSTQNVEEIISNTQEHFKNSLHPIDKNNKDSRNFLKAKLLNKENFIAPVENANLSNPAMIKKEIVEFSKYRAPAQIMEDIIERYDDLNEFSSFIKNADKDKELIDRKTEFYESESELLRKAFNLYTVLREYNELTNDLRIEAFEALRSKLLTIKDSYEKLHKRSYEIHLMVKGKESELEIYNRATLDKNEITKVNELIEKYKDDLENSPVKDIIIKDGEEIYLEKSKFDKLIKDFESKLEDQIKDKAILITNHLKNISEIKPGSNPGDLNRFYWWSESFGSNRDEGVYKMNDELNQAIDQLTILYVKMKLIEDLKVKDDVSESKTKYDNAMKEYKKIYESYLKEYPTDDEYRINTDLIHSISRDNIHLINPNNQTITIDGKEVSYETILSEISETMLVFYGTLLGIDEKLNLVLNGDKGNIFTSSDNIPSLDELLKLVKNYKTNFNKWEEKANEPGYESDIAEADRKEISERIESEFIENVTEENVNEFKQRVKNIKSEMDKIRKNLEDFKYNKNPIMTIKDYDYFLTVINDNMNKVDKINKDLDSHQKTMFEKYYKQPEKIFDTTNIKKGSHNPVMDPEEDNYEVPKLYKFLYNALERAYKDKDTVDKALKEFDSAKDDAKKLDKSEENSKRFKGSSTPVNKEYSGNSTFKDTNIFASVIGQFRKLLNKDFSLIRDEIFTTTYAMNMFSFATFDNEGMFKLASEEEKKNFSIRSPDYSGQEELWKKFDILNEEDFEKAKAIRFKNRTMTGIRINDKNNQAYLAEIEYILQGTKNNAENVASMYSDLYKIRFGFNQVSAFRNFWGSQTATGRVIKAVATSLYTATSGLVPIPLTKIALLTALTTVESFKDLDRLEAGFPIEPFKSEDDWHYTLPDTDELPVAIAHLAKGEFEEKQNRTTGLYYSDYLTVFLLSYLSGNLSDDPYMRIAELIQTNIGAKTSGDYSLKNSNSYYELKAKVKVDPILFTLNLFKDYVDGQEIRKDWNTYDIDIVRGY